MQEAATVTGEAGARIDAGLLRTASGADAVELAAARVEGAQAKLAAATEAQATAERGLMDLRAREGASADELGAATDRLAEADKRAALAAKALADEQRHQGDVAAASALASDDAATKTDLAAAKTDKASKSNAGHASSLGGVTKAAGIAALGIGIAGGMMVKAAGDFQSSTQHLVTDAGESQQNLAMVQAGILKLAASTGTSAGQLSDAMYHIESAGFHGKAGLDVLAVAAQGAKVGGADFDTVAKTLTGTLNSYSDKGYSTASMMNQLIATVGAGDMKMQDLASSLGNVAPLAAAAGLDFSQVGGAIATMTAQNMSADQATQDLANTIRNLQKPSDVAVKEMAALGLNSNDVANNLGKRGLTGTLDMLTQAVGAHTKGGQVLISTYKASATASADAASMMKAMPPELAKMAQGYLDGSVSAKQWKKDIGGLDPIHEHLMSQFAGVANKTHSFNDLLAKGGPAAQTYNAAMAQLLGGATGLNTALMLTGGRMQTFKDNTAAIATHADATSKTVDNWDKIQGTFNQKLEVAKASAGATAIQIGTALLPAAMKLMGVVQSIVTPIANWVSGHQQLTVELLGGAAALAAFVAAVGVVSKIAEAFGTSIGGARKFLGLLRSDQLATAASATANAAKTAAAWLASTARMIGQGLASAAVWSGRMIANFVSAAASAVANAATTTATWLASTAATVADAAATGAVWVAARIAQFLTVSAAAVAQGAVTAGAWIAANAAMLLASGGIVLLLAGIVTAVVELAKHWSQIWHDIKQAAIDAWHFIDQNVVHPIEAGFDWLYRHAIQPLAQEWDAFWGGLKRTAVDMWNAIYNNVISPMKGAFDWVSNTLSNIGGGISSAAGAVGSFFSFDEGGYVPGSSGQAMLAVVHGGEYVLSRDMLAGRTTPNIPLLAAPGSRRGPALALAPTGGSGGGASPVYVIVQGNQILGDAGVKQLATKVGNTIARQLLPAAGVRIRA